MRPTTIPVPSPTVLGSSLISKPAVRSLVQRSAGQLDVPFGTAERLRYDFFEGESGASTLLFIHGGYWQMRHKNTFGLWLRARSRMDCMLL